ncbi:MAG: M48 family metalloprotease [Candidatus Brocadia sp.]|nr:MAG: M48 family metalloprotease [Candidatus Brocadia sp.]
MMLTKRLLFLIAVSVMSFFFTERFSFADDDWQLPDTPAEIGAAEEIELGKQVDEYIRHQFYLEEDPDFNEAVNSIVQKVVAASDRSTLPFTCVILQSLSINAFSAPGGHIYLTYGLLKFAQTEDEVAGIIGHEVAHVSLRHASKLYHEVMEINSQHDEGLRSTANLLLLHSHLEEFEQDADTKGILYAQKAGFNPNGLLDFLERHLNFMMHRRFFGMTDSGFTATITARLNHLRECLSNLEKSNY